MSRRDTTHEAWALAEVPDQQGRTAVITGANTGVGFEVAEVLARHGATVVLACRSLERATEAADRIRDAAPDATVETVQLDLASLASVHRAADQIGSGHPHLDLLVNNAGIMFAPRGRTEDGFELHLGTNHLGHFALTGLLLDRLLATPGSRIVTITSPAHRQGDIDFDDLQSERRYRRSAAYGQSKLANLLFAYELQRRLDATGSNTISLAAHPGAARTELNRHMSFLVRGRSWGLARAITHSAPEGARTILRAALDPAARGGEYYAPNGRWEFKGSPATLRSSARSHDATLQRRLWNESERLTAVTYHLPTPTTHP
jgi:NAD(P)-dependent dehydrogenase (short-subunit alcohol dehydrogenase family)